MTKPFQNGGGGNEGDTIAVLFFCFDDENLHRALGRF